MWESIVTFGIIFAAAIWLLLWFRKTSGPKGGCGCGCDGCGKGKCANAADSGIA